MPLSGSALGAAMKAAMTGQTDSESAFEALGEAIVTYIKANAQVNPTTLSAPNGPVSGTGTIS